MKAQRALRGLLSVAMVASAGGLLVSAAEPVAVRLLARYWPVPPDVWTGRSTWTPPEKAALDKRRLSDLGVAFSGGGTRSAAATVGQLRGLLANGWLKHVRYLTAVSGGSWTAVPFTYAQTDAALLLGKPLPPEELTLAEVEPLAKEPAMARSIAQSGLFAQGAREAVKIVTRAELAKRKVPPEIESVLNRFIGGQTSETYANLLSKFFISPYIRGGSTLKYTWDKDSLDDIKAVDPSLSVGEFVRAADDRPFLIVGGTMIYQHPAYDYPRLIPVEYTPLYTGVRQQFGDRLGGIYVSPFAYDAAGAEVGDGQTVRVTAKARQRPFTLADVVASSGAAPLLALYRGVPATVLKRATVVFPTFNHFTVRMSPEGAKSQPVVERLLHGDGGFSDNLGVMPLLARQVHNILVFVNGQEPFTENKSIESMFWPLAKYEDVGGDRSMNDVFEPAQYWELKEGLEKAVASGGPAVYCGENWKVRANEIYNVAPYDNLNICWVHNELIPAWVGQLPEETKKLLETKPFKHFPWFATFEENKPYVIRLSSAQVNLLAHLSAWSVTSDKGRQTIERAMGQVLQD